VVEVVLPTFNLSASIIAHAQHVTLSHPSPQSYAFAAGLWIPTDLIRIRIEHFCSIQIRVQAKTELSKTFSFSNFFELKI
jgi:hypothetical protein